MNKQLRIALERYFQETGTTARELAQEVGVTESTVSRWRSGSHGAWRRHEAKLRAILGDRLPAKPGGHAVRWENVPVLGMASAAGYDPAAEPIEDYAIGQADEYSTWPTEHVRPGVFCLRVDGDSMSPEYPDGTLLLVSGTELPQPGDVAVARLGGGEVVVKTYAREGSVVRLTSINPQGRSYQIDLRTDPHGLTWIYPVRHALLNYRRPMP